MKGGPIIGPWLRGYAVKANVRNCVDERGVSLFEEEK
jgi:hypothetical protein